MEVILKNGPREPDCKIEVKDICTIEAIVKELQSKLPYAILAAHVDNKIVELTHKIDKPCKIELLDMRNQSANLIYQNSLSLIYMKAVYDVLGDIVVEIQNSINKGLYTMIRRKMPVTQAEVDGIYKRMRELVDLDIPYVKEDSCYSLEGFKKFFFGLMVPSTGYIKLFEIRKYRRGVLLRFPHPKNPNVIPDYVDEVKLYGAFGEATNWGKLMEVSYARDLNAKVRNGEYEELIQLSEALHEKKVAELADIIKKEKKRIVLIAGPSSSGKTTFAKRLLIQLKVNGLKPLYMGTDDYFVERENTPLDENGEPNFEDLEAIDIELFNANMNSLLAGEEVDLPTFDFMDGHKKFGKRLTKITSGQPIIIEGIHALNRELTALIPDTEKFKIYISPLTQLNIDENNRIPTTDARMLRRMVRDYNFRGHSAKNTINSWPKVRAGEDKNIFPFSNEADAFFNSVHLYEISVLKKYAEPLLKEIQQEEPVYSEAQRLLKILDFFEVIEDDSIIANNSILREFIGGSILV
ncbi:nucleoside kinase [Aminipila luticellarii]|uniref:Nucleoside kinase n=1 Tax=Aminipila luticellarii TaxID=2507160 RepID=A0A410PT18_9FIRM|nr:nucleoside kinase [Aminipila luticellarii]QAT42050.1 nucleoside kinase [Aminipila luticellarii]